MVVPASPGGVSAESSTVIKKESTKYQVVSEKPGVMTAERGVDELIDKIELKR